MSRKEYGLTLVEILIVISIMSVIVALGLPSMTRFIQSNQLTSTTNELLGDIQRTRVAALRNGSIEHLDIYNTCTIINSSVILCTQGFSQTPTNYGLLQRLSFGPQGQLLFIKNDPPPFGYIAVKHNKLDRARCIRILPTGNALVVDCPADINIGGA